MRRILRAVVLAVVVAVSACGTDDSDGVAARNEEEPASTNTSTGAGTSGTGVAASEEEEEAPEPSRPGAPPPVQLHFDGGSVELRPWTYCYGNACVDGAPPEDLPDVGGTDMVTVDFPLPDWAFEASFSEVGVPCPRDFTAPLIESEDGTSTLRPAGYAGTYDVTLFGRGAGGGDLFVSFRWTTTEDGPLPEPEATMAVLADHDGSVDSYGVELTISGLPATPSDVTATITVRSSAGKALTFDATRAPGCISEGTIAWDGPDDQGLAAAALGEPPFTYEVEVRLDGSRHTAVATWPADVIVGNEPSVVLDFAPDLPALE